MAKKSAIQTNLRRIELCKKNRRKWQKLKSELYNKQISVQERFMISLEMSKMPKNSNKNRIRNRCELTGRPRGYHGDLKMSRIQLRDLASKGMIPGLKKASW